ncbi:hypothetical protein [Dactylosporangium sp. CA-092794]|uniref:hypothetical protein n=1 Tax=Dactylosporangium sp. CA-092794 TaxID=3239929 RepID=UPI003D89B95D
MAAERGWDDVAAAAGWLAGDPVMHALVLAAARVAEPGGLAARCKADATADLAAGDPSWWAEKLLIALPAAVPEDAAPELFAEVRRRWADRPRGSCVVVTVLEPGDADVRRNDRTLRRLLGDTTTDHLVWSPDGPAGPLAERLAADAEQLAGFLTAEPDERFREYQRRNLIAALDERIGATPEAGERAAVAPAAPAAAAPVVGPARLHTRAQAWLRRTETELLAGIDAVEQRLNRETTAGTLDRARLEGRTMAAFEEWRRRAEREFPDRWADLLDELSAPGESPAPVLPQALPRAVPPPTAQPRAGGSAGLRDVAAPVIASAVAATALSALTSKRNAEIGALVAGAVTFAVRWIRRVDARDNAVTAERIDGRRYVGEAAAAARQAVGEVLRETVVPRVDALVASLAADPPPPPAPALAGDRGADLLRAARRALAAPDLSSREEQEA